MALQLGIGFGIDGEEAQRAAAANDGQIGRSWNLWRQRLGQIDI